MCEEWGRVTAAAAAAAAAAAISENILKLKWHGPDVKSPESTSFSLLQGPRNC